MSEQLRSEPEQYESTGGFLNIGCGDSPRPGYWNVDVLDAPHVDEKVDLAAYPWPWPDEHFAHIHASHVLEHLPDLQRALDEAERVLKPGGALTVYWPMGMNERADPDHEQSWVWDSPLYYCGERPWDHDCGLDVVDRDVTIHQHLNGGVGVAYRAAIDLYRWRHGNGRWQFDLPATSGEFKVVFEK